MLKIRRPLGRLIFNMGIAIPGKTVFLIETTPWSYPTAKMNLTNLSPEINLDSYEARGEWELYKTETTRHEFFYECCPGLTYANIAFKMFMRRRYTFCVLNVILPSIMTSVLLLLISFCPAEQKVQLGLVVMLSFMIFLYNVPKSSDHVPLLGELLVRYIKWTLNVAIPLMYLTRYIILYFKRSLRNSPRMLICYILSTL